jgi:hypothetical protein
MRRLLGVIILATLLLIALTRTGAILPVYAEPLPEQTRQLLEKSLSKLIVRSEGYPGSK